MLNNNVETMVEKLNGFLIDMSELKKMESGCSISISHNYNNQTLEAAGDTKISLFSLMSCTHMVTVHLM